MGLHRDSEVMKQEVPITIELPITIDYDIHTMKTRPRKLEQKRNLVEKVEKVVW